MIPEEYLYDRPIDYNNASEEEIAKQIMYTSAIFDIEEMMCDEKKDDFNPLSVTIVTPNQKFSTIFDDKQVKGGHAKITDIMLGRIYQKYKCDGSEKEKSVGQGIYSENEEHNIFLLTAPGYVMLVTQEENQMNEMQHNLVKDYVTKIMEAENFKDGKIIFFWRSTWFKYFSIEEINDTKEPQTLKDMEKNNKTIEERILQLLNSCQIVTYNNVPEQSKLAHDIVQMDFSDCKDKKGIRNKIGEYFNKVKNMASFFKERIFNTERENEAREVVKQDVQEVILKDAEIGNDNLDNSEK